MQPIKNYSATFQIPFNFYGHDDVERHKDREIWYGTSAAKVEVFAKEDFTIIKNGTLFFKAKSGSIDGLCWVDLDGETSQERIGLLKKLVSQDVADGSEQIQAVLDYIMEYRKQNHPHRGHLPFVIWEKIVDREGIQAFKVVDGFSAYFGGGNILGMLAGMTREDKGYILLAYRRHCGYTPAQALAKINKLAELAKYVEDKPTERGRISYIKGKSLNDALKRSFDIRGDSDVKEFADLYWRVTNEVKQRVDALVFALTGRGNF